MARQLSDPEVQQLFRDLPQLYQKTLRHDEFVRAYGWNQVAFALSDKILPIPVRGVTVQDNGIGTVIVFADAGGSLHYILAETSNDASLAAEIQKPEFVSPTVGLLDALNDLLDRATTGVTSYLNMAIVFFLLAMALWIYQTLRS